MNRKVATGEVDPWYYFKNFTDSASSRGSGEVKSCAGKPSPNIYSMRKRNGFPCRVLVFSGSSQDSLSELCRPAIFSGQPSSRGRYLRSALCTLVVSSQRLSVSRLLPECCDCWNVIIINDRCSCSLLGLQSALQ